MGSSPFLNHFRREPRLRGYSLRTEKTPFPLPFPFKTSFPCFHQSCDLIGSRIFSENFSPNGRLFQSAREYASAASKSASNTAVI